MNKKLKELIKKALPYKDEILNGLLIVNSGKLYNGFWGKNGYNNIIVIGHELRKNNTRQYYFLTENSDVVDIENIESCHIDIDHDLGCVGVWFCKPIKAWSILSACSLEGVNRNE